MRNPSFLVRLMILFFAGIFLLTGCGIPLPEDKWNYAGLWQAPGMSLFIGPDGSVRYKRIRKGVTTKISAPVQEFRGDDFVVGFAFIKTTFEVSRSPYLEGNEWKMVVDGVVLTRVSGGPPADDDEWV